MYIIEVDIINNKVEELKVILQDENIRCFNHIGGGKIICGTYTSYFMIENEEEPNLITKHGWVKAICVLSKLGDKYKDLAITCENNYTFILNMEKGVITQIMITGNFRNIFVISSDDDSFTFIARGGVGVLKKFTVKKELLDLCLM